MIWVNRNWIVMDFTKNNSPVLLHSLIFRGLGFITSKERKVLSIFNYQYVKVYISGTFSLSSHWVKLYTAKYTARQNNEKTSKGKSRILIDWVLDSQRTNLSLFVIFSSKRKEHRKELETFSKQVYYFTQLRNL